MEISATGAEIGRALAARRRQVQSHCATCGDEITGVATRRYCSTACRLRASRQRRRQSSQAKTPPIVERLNRVRETIMRGRQFDDSTEILRQLRQERAAVR
jgi:hypothetical protein